MPKLREPVLFHVSMLSRPIKKIQQGEGLLDLGHVCVPGNGL